MTAFELGKKATSILDNPFWKEYPNRCKTELEGVNARRFVDGYVNKLIEQRNQYENS
jgi:hypothetical protein